MASETIKSAVREMLSSEGSNRFTHRAVQSCSHPVLTALLDIGAPVDLQDKQGETALHWAARKGCTTCAKALINAWSSLSISSTSEWTPLMLAARRGHVGIIEMLITAGADPNLRGFHGWTALHVSRTFNHDGARRVLVGAGGDEKILDNDGLRPGEAILRHRFWGVL
ncbi:ankyrin repeat-containing domain protein [Fusarium flagelliforme]|uniref:ankyrin repeat-containing domain protein n=1 Tax=Fusarium flagelliforme TaxID=2675880 RepID=UPI001E8ECAEC|nr:ankyrin repeat-containing domain protein [Fusarium flagelliforme]KAH7186016.1 ankyrin repeat-containing domain protein [Fusarium flagelliforme]